MGKVLISDSILTGLANLIRSKKGNTDKVAPVNMAAAFTGIFTTLQGQIDNLQKEVNDLQNQPSGGGLPAGISAMAVGTHTPSADFSTTRQTITHGLGVVPDLVLYFYAGGNIATTNSMLFAMRGNAVNWRSGYNSFYIHHANSTSTNTLTNSNNANYGVGNLTATTFTIQSHSSSIYWRKGYAYTWVAIKF